MLRSHDTCITSQKQSIQERLSCRIVTGSDQDIRTLRQVNATIFPISYHDKFYKDLGAACGDLACRAVFILLDDRDIIGTFSCRFESPPPIVDTAESITRCTYVMTFGVLAKYRLLGVGEWMWERLMGMYEGGTGLMVLHVQVGNSSALRFYKRRGFVERIVVKDYYRRLTPPDAVLLT